MKKYIKRYLIFVFIAILLFTQGIFAEDLGDQENEDPIGLITLSLNPVNINDLSPIDSIGINEAFGFHVIMTNTSTTTISNLDYVLDKDLEKVLLPVNELEPNGMVDFIIPLSLEEIGQYDLGISVTGEFVEEGEVKIYSIDQLASINIIDNSTEEDPANGPEDGAEDDASNEPEDGTDDDAANEPEDGAEDDASNEPEDGTEDGTDDDPADDAAANTEDPALVLLDYELDIETIALPNELAENKRCRWFLDEVVTYKYIVTNKGTETIDGFRFIDVDINENVDKDNLDDWTIFEVELASLESEIFYRTYRTNKLGDFNNYSYVQGLLKTSDNSDEAFEAVGEEAWNWECIEVYQPAIIELTKVAVVSEEDDTLVTEVNKGDTVTYKFTICNKGPHPFGEVKLYDDMLDLDILGERFGALEPGEIKEVYYNYIAETEGDLVNNAKVEGYLDYHPATEDYEEYWCRMVEDTSDYTVTVLKESVDPGTDPGTDPGNGTNPGSNPTPTPKPGSNPTTTPKPEPTPTPTPEPKEVVDDPTPQEPIETVPTEKDKPSDIPEEFTDLDIPQDVPGDLPKSGGTLPTIYYLLGGGISYLGFLLKRK